jgi:hypothetical protein
MKDGLRQGKALRSEEGKFMGSGLLMYKEKGRRENLFWFNHYDQILVTLG